MSWTAPANAGKPAIVNYDVQYRAGNSGAFTNGPQNVTGTSTALTGLTANTSYQVRVRATNAEGDGPWSPSGTGTTGTNSAPAFAAATAARSVAENSAAGANVGAVIPAATDADGDSLTYTMGGTDAASFAFNASTRQITTRAGVTYDHEAKSSYTVTVTASDDTDSDTVTVTITVTDVAEPPIAPAAPTVTATSGSTTGLDVSWTAPANAGKPAIVNYDVQYRAGNSGAFTNGPQNVTGTSTALTGLTANTSYQVRVRATNAEGDGPWSPSGTGTTGTNSAPAFAAATAARSVAENSAAGANVGAVIPAATDADGDSLTYTMGGTDAASFAFNASTRQITTRAGVTYDHEAKSSYTVTVTASDDTDSDTVTVTITVTDVAEPPIAPAAPTVTATSGSTTGLDVSWTAPANAGKPAIVNYDVQYRAGNSGAFTNGPQNVTGTGTAIAGLAMDTAYEVRVRATNAEGDSPWSASGSGMTAAPTLAAGDVTEDGATLTLNGGPGTWHYRGDKAPHNACSAARTSATATLARLIPGTGYTYTAYSDGSCTTALASVSFTTRMVRPPVAIAAVASPVTEGADAAFTVSREGNTALPLTVVLKVSENIRRNQDFVAPGHEGRWEMTIPAGAASATYTVPTTADRVAEQDGEVTLSLRDSDDYLIGSPASATVAVEDDDTAGIAISPTALTVPEGGSGSFTIVLQSAPRSSVEVYVIENGIAPGNPFNESLWKLTANFDVSNWDEPRTIEVSAPEDDDTVNAPVTIRYETASFDVRYRGLTAAVEVVVADNDGASLAAGGIGRNGATLTLDGHSGAWRHRQTAPAGGACSAARTSATATLAGLAAGTDYTWAAYSDASCATELARVSFTTAAPANTAPAVANAIPDRTAPADAAFSFQFAANAFTDADGDSLTYTAAQGDGTALPAWLSFDAGTRTFSGTPRAGDAGTLTVRVTASDGRGGTVSDSFAIEVPAPANTAPAVANAIPDRTATAGAAFSFQFAANAFTDANGDSLTYTAARSGGTALPAWLSFDAGTRTFSGTPAAGDAGTVTVRLRASDGRGGTASDDFDIAVNAAPAVANAIPDRTATAGAAFSFQFAANAFTDANGDSLTYTAARSDGTALPAWLSFDAGTRTFSGTPAAGDTGTVTVRVRASDGRGGTASDDFDIAVNAAPAVANAIPDRTAMAGAAFSFQFAANAFTDADGDSLTYTAARSDGTALPAWLSFDAGTRTFSGTPAAGDAGTVTVRVRASDGRGGTASDDFDIAVAVAAVTVAAVTSPVDEGTGAAFTVSRTGPTAAALTVLVAVSETTAGGQDFVAPVNEGEQRVTIPAGAASATHTVPTAADNTDEPDGAVTVSLRDAAGYSRGSPDSATVSVEDDDAALAAGAIARNGATLTLDDGPGAWHYRGDRAPHNSCSAAQTSATATLAGLAEGTAYTFTAYSDGSCATALASVSFTTLRLRSDIAIAAVASPVTEGADAAFTVSREGSTALPLTVVLKVSENIRRNQDFVAPGDEGEQEVVIPAGAASATYTVPTTDDRVAEQDGEVTLSLRDSDDYLIGSPASATVAVEDDDTAGIAISPTALTVPEGGSGSFTIVLQSAPRSSVEVYVIENGIAPVNPFNEALWRLTANFDVSNWDEPQTIEVSVPDDGDTDGATVTISYETASFDARYRGLTATVEVVVEEADDGGLVQAQGEAPPPVVSIAAGAGGMEGGSASFTLQATPAPASPLSVGVTVSVKGDYGIAAETRTVTIPTTGSVTLTLPTTDDDADEPDGSATLTVDAGDGYTVGPLSSMTVAIQDDDDPVGGLSDGNAQATALPAAHPLVKHASVVKRFHDRITARSQHGDGAAGGWNKRFLKAMGHPEYVDYPQAAVTVADATRLWNHGGPGANTAWDGTVDAVTYAEQYFAGTTTPPPTPDPEITIAAGSGVTEGGSASFTLTATPPPAAPLEVTVTLAASGDYGITAGERTVTIPTSGTYTLTLATDNDGTVEPDGSVTATLAAGTGYTVGAASSGTVAIADDDGLPAVSIHDKTVQEKRGAVTVKITLSEPSTEVVRVTFTTNEARSTATVGEDYLWTRRTVTFSPGETRTLIGVFLLDDSIDDPDETIIVELSNPRGAVIADGEAVITIENSDPLPSAWLTRFGRAAAETAIDGITARMAAPRAPGTEAAVGGYALGGFALGTAGAAWNGDVALDGAGARHPGGLAAGGMPTHPGMMGGAPLGSRNAGQFPGAAAGLSHPGAAFQSVSGAGFGAGPYSTTRSMTLGDLLVGSRLAWTGGADADGGSLGFWGQGSRASFDGAQDGVNLDGEVTTALLGADYARGNWLVGVALTQSRGDGGYRSLARPDEAVASDAPVGDGAIETSLTAAIPYASWRGSERLDLWGAVGRGAGEIALAPESHDALSTDIGWTMAAAGLRSELFASAGGASLALVSDALWARTTSDRISGLAASEGAVARLRLGLEGSRAFQLPGGGSLTPKLELGARHDGGDAETGFGVEVGGGIAWSDPRFGLKLDIEGRALISHEDGAMRDRGFSASLAYDPRADSAQGLTLTLRQDIGSASSGGLNALFADDPIARRTVGYGSDRVSDAGRWSMEAGYGLPAFGGRFVGTPHMSYGGSAFGRDVSVGWRLAPEAGPGAPELSLGVLATRHESDREGADHGVGIEFQARW